VVYNPLKHQSLPTKPKLIDSRWCHACSSKSLQLCIILKDGVILERFAKRTERNGHLGPEKSGFKVQKSAAKTPIVHANSVFCAIKVPCAVALRILNSNSPCMRSPCYTVRRTV